MGGCSHAPGVDICVGVPVAHPLWLVSATAAGDPAATVVHRILFLQPHPTRTPSGHSVSISVHLCRVATLIMLLPLLLVLMLRLLWLLVRDLALMVHALVGVAAAAAAAAAARVPHTRLLHAGIRGQCGMLLLLGMSVCLRVAGLLHG